MRPCLPVMLMLVGPIMPHAAAQPQLRGALTGHASWVTSVAFSPDGKSLASASSDKSIKLWNLAAGKNTATISESLIGVVAFSPDGQTLVASDSDKNIRLWNVATGKMTATFKGSQHGSNSAAFSPDGKTLALGGSGTPEQNLGLWDVATGKQSAIPRGHVGSFGAESVYCVAFRPDGKTLASGGMTIQIWETRTGRRLAKLERAEVGDANSLAFSPDGRTLAAGKVMRDFTIQLWDVTNLTRDIDSTK